MFRSFLAFLLVEPLSCIRRAEMELIPTLGLKTSILLVPSLIVHARFSRVRIHPLVLSC